MELVKKFCNFFLGVCVHTYVFNNPRFHFPGSKGIELFDLLWMEGVENMKILRQVDDGMLKEIGIKLVQRRLLMKAISKL